MSEVLRVVVVGAGGQARDTEFLLKESGRTGKPYECLGFVLSDLNLLGPYDSKERVLGDFGWLERNLSRVDGIVLGLANPAGRLALAQELEQRFPQLQWPTVVHPSAILDWDSATLGRGATISAGVVGTVNAVLEPFALVNVGCTLGHEAVIGAGSVVNHAASISGNVTLGRGVLVGTGARILERLSVGDGAIVGAGAVVTKDVPSGVVMMGVPARPRP